MLLGRTAGLPRLLVSIAAPAGTGARGVTSRKLLVRTHLNATHLNARRNCRQPACLPRLLTGLCGAGGFACDQRRCKSLEDSRR